MSKTTFTSHGSDGITIQYTDVVTGLSECRTFATRGRYVYELIGHNGCERQVCKKLAHGGVTLMVDEDTDFEALIRREYSAARRADRKALAC